eukprot:TRINITY_DN3502_c1_g1_i1.p1 TRINITY_DN3502_c1_g1~~TRINITY_DN3502_c1_g1_i1.p1  ORF type:complete len:586 (+),score=107.85 TRINITY_DN3502_c1_g1_i1:64-1821(+)
MSNITNESAVGSAVLQKLHEEHACMRDKIQLSLEEFANTTAKILDEAVQRALSEMNVQPESFNNAAPNEEDVAAVATSDSPAAKSGSLSREISISLHNLYDASINSISRPSPSSKSKRGVDLAAERVDVRRALGYDQTDYLSNTVSNPPRSSLMTGQSSLISLKAQESFRSKMGLFERIIESNIFEHFCGACIIFNAFSIGLQANQRALEPTKPCDGPWSTINLALNIFFFFELTARLSVYRCRFFTGGDARWNCFDLVVVGCGCIEEVFSRLIVKDACGRATGDINLNNGITSLRILRGLRVVRIMRVVRAMSLFKELKVMTQSIMSCLVPLFWACILLLGCEWCFGVYFVHLGADFVADSIAKYGVAALEEKEVKDVREYYGSLWKALYTLFQTVTGGIDWQNAADSLLAIGYHPIALYIFYVALTTFAVLNVVTGVFVENATKNAQRDRELAIQEKLQHRQTYIKDVLSVFTEADSDNSGQVTWEEFQEHLQDKRVQAFFSYLELDTVAARRLFRLMDLDQSGAISAEEFVTGCMCLKGGAKTIDVAAVFFEFSKMQAAMEKQLSGLNRRMAALAASSSISV